MSTRKPRWLHRLAPWKPQGKSFLRWFTELEELPPHDPDLQSSSGTLLSSFKKLLTALLLPEGLPEPQLVEPSSEVKRGAANAIRFIAASEKLPCLTPTQMTTRKQKGRLSTLLAAEKLPPPDDAAPTTNPISWFSLFLPEKLPSSEGTGSGADSGELSRE